MRKRVAQSLRRAEFVRFTRGRLGCLWSVVQTERHRQHQQGGSGQGQQREAPTQVLDEPAGKRHHQELAKRAGRTRDAHGHGAFVGLIWRPRTP